MDPYETDLALQEAVAREHGGWGAERLRTLGRIAGSTEAREHADRAEHHSPTLHGNTVDCDPSWHWLLATAIEHEVPSLAWRENRPGAQVVRAALGYLWGQLNTGVMCPLIMTFAAVPVLRRFGGDRWIPRLTRDGALAGQAYTEQQGGSDLRRTATKATRLDDGSYELWGHKWFVSAPMCELFLTLAQTEAGLSCFLVERAGGFEIVRLKEKLGTRSLPTAEVEFRGVRGWLIGEEGQGLKPLVHNVSYARLGPAAAPEMRAALVAAIQHARHRTAFGALLADQPAMLNVLADLALDSEAATVTLLRMARAYEDYDSPFRRLATTVNEYWGCGRVTGHVAEAMQCFGGNGYTENSGMPRLLRDAAVHPIWEGSGNVVALDVLRAMAKEPAAVDAFLAECALARGGNRHLDTHLVTLRQTIADLPTAASPQFHARRVAEDLAVALQASLLIRHSPAFVADAFCAARLGPDRGRTYGTLPAGVDARAIVERALPA